jgi:transcription-repair coupling factor (superfamily II helicase)
MHNILTKVPGYNDAVDAVKKSKYPILLSGLAGSAGALAAASLFSDGGFRGALLVIVPGYDQVISWAADMELLMPDREVLVFNPAEALPFEVVAASREPAAGRLQALALLRGHPQQVIHRYVEKPLDLTCMEIHG